MTKSLKAGGRKPASCQGYDAGSRTTQFENGKGGSSDSSRANGSRLNPVDPWPAIQNLYSAPSATPGTNPAQWPSASGTSRPGSDGPHSVKPPQTKTSFAR